MYKVKSKKLKILIIGLFVLGMINIPSFLSAEMQIEIQEGEIEVTTSPNNPQPYQNVTIKISSYATDLNKATITWQENSKTLLSGIGKTSYAFTAYGPNTSTTFDITIKPANSMSTVTKRVTIAPSEIEIMWEALNGYTPPFYKGKSLPVSGGMVKAVAIPNTNTIKSGNGSITYTWKNNDNTVLEASGYNKNSYVFKNDVFDSKNEIKVTASSVSGNYNAETSIQIPTYNPKIIFYRKSPAEGVFYNIALDKEARMAEEEMTLVAAPYFLPLNGNEGNFTYDWQINGKMIDTPRKKTELTVRPNSRGGYANISLVIENINELFQKVTNNLKLTL
ncbi:MAG: hypothetical protein UR85_C0002G0064 [Candidatus Nomurabacteria bacterium GW2011_GWF2_35_66]|uniref:Uncharacterized protein n=1 Tax=Candidatus Nomurabacteria bacterium GW2011_GWE1_35_16 TaxID=1618761 RepID=A0A0G0BB41_9BACT|nr:MAG: hypothetical protein UR55_C0004G0024 [Candidatus Nomurabacteria bacterium GW2011_GWF1_34_20]KKP63463.1 MAG: hypothetical protein UR57_C0004G0024 [Candidatus Nomurabacteria bacterium GW2011_GWE2_34_25]KKP66643.1 MAG: hypothetical protein UR64_C0004G0024 [Candidatus Nomurabacteria bacterium GW2011_GWE1_35_16]KKP83751.1 MAG: hypothetical protein UR85_C0002G0064 [Candidatus Nomurabacteria bacterium GW2011_GWF2_35_66]HAE36442.1 hypothetical protein [Candidatus Nomurabacteria bacterium]